MKKSILILVLAVFASITVAFGQATPGNEPRPLINCDTGPLNPIAGVPYDYSATLAPAGGTAYWFATFNNTQFMTGGTLTSDQEVDDGTGDFIAIATNYQSTVTGVTSPTTTNITWKSDGLAQVTPANPLFVVLHYTAPDPGGCADNLKVFRIEPINAFLVNVLNLGQTTYGPGGYISDCYSEMASASYDLGVGCMIYDYGINHLDFEIVAANFTESFTPSFRINGIQTGQTIEVLWSYFDDFSATASLGTISADGIVAGTLITTNETNTSLGVSIYVRLVVNNNGYEGLTADQITLAAAGINSAGQPNVRWDDCSIDVVLAAAFADPNGPDFALQTLNPRPTVEENMAVGDDFEEPCTP